ncbi:hypothetical protein [Nocardia sp. NBC_01388]|uniref:hypothetical protein n=1 Tax=Nocardia sp. NBC_01388 TaxID=2903596 RepID=UPI00324F77AC
MIGFEEEPFLQILDSAADRLRYLMHMVMLGRDQNDPTYRTALWAAARTLNAASTAIGAELSEPVSPDPRESTP